MPSLVPLRPADWTAGIDEPVARAAISPDGSRAVVLGVEGSAALVDGRSGGILRRFAAHADGGFQAAWSPADDRFATSGQDGKVRIWRPLSEDAAVLDAPTAWVEHLAWSPRGDLLAAAAGKSLLLHRPADGTTRVIGDHRSTLAAVCWSDDGATVGAACYGGVVLHEPATGRRAQLPWKTSLVSAALAPGGRWLVAGTQEMSVQIWPLPFAEGEELAMSGYPGKVRQLAWHHSGRLLATAGGDAVMVWDFGGKGPAGTTPRILEGHAGRVNALAYQASGHLLASGGEDGSILFWNAGKSSLPLRQVRLHAAITSLCWTRDGSKILAGCHDGRIALASGPS